MLYQLKKSSCIRKRFIKALLMRNIEQILVKGKHQYKFEVPEVSLHFKGEKVTMCFPSIKSINMF